MNNRRISDIDKKQRNLLISVVVLVSIGSPVVEVILSYLGVRL